MPDNLPSVPETMKALTIVQPWASLIVYGEKRFETRGWTAPPGWIAIHAGKRKPANIYLENIIPGAENTVDLPRGVILGWVWLSQSHSTDNPNFLSKLSGYEKELGDYSPGRYAWELTHIYRLHTPIPAKGALGLWQWSRPAGPLPAGEWAEIPTIPT
jgi:hypothetical protein